MPKSLFWIGLALSLTLSACRDFDLDDLEPLNYEAEFAIPLISSNISVKDFLEEINENDNSDFDTLLVDEDGLLHFQYRGSILGTSAEDLFEDINNSIPPFIPVTSRRMALPFAIPNGIDVDSLIVKTAELEYNFTNPWQEEVDVEIRFPEIELNGEILKINLTAPPKPSSGAPPIITGDPISLSGYSITPVNDTVYIEYDAVRKVTQDTVPLGNFLLTITDFRFSYVEGFLGQQVHEAGKDTINIDFFESWTQGDVVFLNPSVTIFFENSFGVPTRAVVNQFDVLTADGQILPLIISDPDLQNGLDVPIPAVAGESRISEFLFDSTNTNIPALLSSKPVEVIYDISGIINPANDPDQKGFVTDSSFYAANLLVDLPLYGKASNFLVRDTFEINLEDIENAKSAEIKIVADNGIPLDMEVQVEFQDSLGNVTGRLLEDGELVIEGPEVDDEGNPIGVNSLTTFVPVPEDELEGLKRADIGILVATFATSGNDQPVRITEEQEADIRMGTRLVLTN